MTVIVTLQLFINLICPNDHTDVNNNDDEVQLPGTESTTKYDTPTRSELKLGYMRSTPSKCSENNAGRSWLWWPYMYKYK